ncbi:MAG: TonB-dependent receptor [Caulobacteraceae bacterium]|nr:TonB-dependent receptor [Caulobacteraceae bacterium]
MKRLLLSTAGLALALSTPVLADSSVGELVVTAARLPADPAEITGARIIDRQEIEARQAVFATDVLSLVPGISVARTGAFGGTAALRIRGASPDKTLVLIDGVPLNDPSDPNGTYDFSSLQLDDIERIEVLSGPQSSLWGSDAIGGVVSLTSRELDGWRVMAEGGSFSTFHGSLAAGVADETRALGVSLAGYRSDGISKADKDDGATEKDGFETVTASVNGRLTVSDRLSLDGRVRYTDTDTEIDGFPAPAYLLGDTPDRYRSQTWSGFGRAKLKGVVGLDHELSVSAYDIDRENRSDFPSRYTADSQTYRWLARRGEMTDPWSFALGLEREEAGADLDGRADVDAGATAGFGVARFRPSDRFAVTASLRHDDTDDYGGRTTGRLSLAGQIAPGLTLTASAGTGFKAPTISQIVCDFCFAPPVPLKAEKAEGYDLRLGWRSPDGRWGAAATAYKLSVKDQIAYVASRYINIARTRSQGLELEADAALTEAVRLKASYAFTEAEDRSTGLDLLRVPQRSGAISLLYDDGKWDGALTLRGESSQADTARDGFSRISRDGFAVVDVAAGYAVNERIKLTTRIENLTGTDYQETFGYGEPDTAVYVGVRLRN